MPDDPTPVRGEWRAEDVRRLPLTVDLVTAASILDLGITKSRQLARAGQFPVPVIRHGAHYKVPTASLLRILDLAS